MLNLKFGTINNILAAVILTMGGLTFTPGWAKAQEDIFATAPTTDEAPLTPLEDMIDLSPQSTLHSVIAKSKAGLTPPVKAIDDRFAPQMDPATRANPEDDHNISALWQMVLAKNPVIQYGLKQLATPPELRYAHASAMSRALGGLLSGATLLPYAMGAGQVTAGAAVMGTNLADRAVQQTQKLDPSKLPSDTELVELSGIVQELQKNLVQSYFDYKFSLQAWSQQRLLKQQFENQTSAADTPEQTVWQHYLMVMADADALTAKHMAEKHYLILERLVGTPGIQKLHFEGTLAVIHSQLPAITHAGLPTP